MYTILLLLTAIFNLKFKKIFDALKKSTDFFHSRYFKYFEYRDDVSRFYRKIL